MEDSAAVPSPDSEGHDMILRNLMNWLSGNKQPPPQPAIADEIGDLLTRWREPGARESLFALLYPELHRAAEARMRRERPDHTLQPTALVNEVFLQLVRQEGIRWQSRAHFMAIASEAMRRILVDHARARSAQRRQGGTRIPLEPEVFSAGEDFSQLLELDDLLNRLAARDPRLARVVELRYFGGLTFQEVAEILGTSERTAKRDWQMARAWLSVALNPEGPDDARPEGPAKTAD